MVINFSDNYQSLTETQPYSHRKGLAGAMEFPTKPPLLHASGFAVGADIVTAGLTSILFDAIPTALLWSNDVSGVIVNCNQAAEKLLARSKAEIVGQRLTAFQPFPGKGHPASRAGRTARTEEIEAEIVGTRGKRIPVRIISTFTVVQGERFILSCYRDIGKEKKLEKNLQQVSHDLEETNTALRVLLKQGEQEKQEFREHLQNSINDLLSSPLQKLKKTQLSTAQQKAVTLIEDNLIEFLSPANRTLSLSSLRLSPTETQIANLILQGKHTKEIAERMRISPWTVNVHRRNIRKKHNITNKKVNLRTALESLIR